MAGGEDQSKMQVEHPTPTPNGDFSAFVLGVQQAMTNLGLDQVLPEIASIKQLIIKVETKQESLEHSLEFTQSNLTKTDSRVDCLESENLELKSRLNYMESKMFELDKKQGELSEKNLDLQFRSMKNNLVFYKIPEMQNENTKRVLMDFIVTYLKIDPTCFDLKNRDPSEAESYIWISRCHRFGQVGPKGTPRPIVAVFVEGKQMVLNHAKNLRGSPYIVSTQLPPELAENKRYVQPMYKYAREQKRKPRFVGRGDTVKVDDTIYSAKKVPQCKASIPTIIENTPNMQIKTTQPIVHTNSKFVGQIAKATNLLEASMALSAMKHSNNNGTCSATHNIYATRFFQNGVVQEYLSDDGEHGAARTILQLMQQSSIVNQVIMVSRWYGGTHIGVDRFRIIGECTKAAIMQLTHQITPMDLKMNSQMFAAHSPTSSSESSQQSHHDGGAIPKSTWFSGSPVQSWTFQSPTLIHQVKHV